MRTAGPWAGMGWRGEEAGSVEGTQESAEGGCDIIMGDEEE
jgi:hypothetical protein